MAQLDSTTEFYLKQLYPLVDGKIIGLAHDGTGYFALRVQTTDGNVSQLWLLSDDEGNAPGSFAIEQENSK